MAAINFPDAPTNGQIFESGGMSWTYVAGIGWTLNSAIVEAGSGFTFIADTMPLPVNVGDTWFDSSTGASGGTSWVAVEEGPAGASEKVWVQFAPAQQALPPLPIPAVSLTMLSGNVVNIDATAKRFICGGVVRDNMAMLSGTDGYVYIKKAGWYAVDGHAMLNYNYTTPPSQVQVEVRLNEGVDNRENLRQNFVAAANVNDFHVSGPRWYDVGQRVSLWISQVGGTNVNPFANASTAQPTSFHMAYLGADQ